jgi:TPP-dependent pyruvate/acetoin dehydrogenase alpha subunit
MNPDPLALYENMLRSRLFEEAVCTLWEEGLISGEMHASLGEEAITAGIVCQLEEGDALALDHRGTAALVMRGLDLVSLLREFLGKSDGLCAGQGGHMHLYSRDHLAASSGIVGSSGPAGAGFALAAQYLRPGKIAVAFFGEGAANQGMLLESLNLAATWRLPLIFVCKDNGWSITTHSRTVTAGNLVGRARSFGMPAVQVDGSDVSAIWAVAEAAITRARSGKGPSFLLASCTHLEGHFLGFQLFRLARNLVPEMTPLVMPMTKALCSWKGASLNQRLNALLHINQRIKAASREAHSTSKDPVLLLRQKLDVQIVQIAAIEGRLQAEIAEVVTTALAD